MERRAGHLLRDLLGSCVTPCHAVVKFMDVYQRSYCRPIETLVDIFQEYPDEIEYIFKPSCVPLMRCGGCCNDEGLECVPTEEFNITMQVGTCGERGRGCGGGALGFANRWSPALSWAALEGRSQACLAQLSLLSQSRGDVEVLPSLEKKMLAFLSPGLQ